MVCLIATPVVAQTVTSTITGSVSDPSGDAIPGTTVRITNQETGVATDTKANAAGLYRVPSLSPGRYRIEAEAKGFQRLVRSDVVLQVSQTLELDLTLQVGKVTETVTVRGAAPVVESQTSSVGQLVERSMIEGMPLPNRAATAMVLLSPNAVVIDQGSGGENIPIFTVGGGRARNQSYTLDGGNVTNVVGLAVPQQQTSLPMDAMQEFRVISNNYAAEYGHSTGGVVTLSTRAGTNKFHGSLFEYARNDAFDARNFFSASKPRLRLNQFGGSLGGPIRKDKMHFFTSWEQTRQITGGTAIQTVPDALQRAGDFSQTRTAGGQPNLIYDPATTSGNTRQPFPGNVIPSNRIDPTAKAVTAFWPTPNRAGSVTGANNFSANSRPGFTRNIVVSRLDHQLRNADQLMVRYYINDNHSTNPGVWGIPVADSSANTSDGRTQSILGSETHTFNPQTINEFRYSFVRRANLQGRFQSGQGSASKLGLKGVSEVAFPIFSITGFAGMGGQPFRLQTPIQDTQVQDAVLFFRGKHAFKFGAEYRRGYNRDDTDTSSSGNFAFTPLITGLPGVANTGNALASFLLGEVNSARVVRPDVIASHAAYWAWYVQDDWRVTDRLTLNLGLRWETEIPRTVDHDRMNAFDPRATNPVSGTPGVVTFAGRNGVPRHAYDTDYRNFGPRFGFAWRAPGLGSTVIRGGAGIFYGPTVSTIVATSAALGFSTDVSAVATQPGLNSAFLLRDGFPNIPRTPVDQLRPGFGAVPLGQNPNTSVSYFERARPTPMSLQYNLDIQHELRSNLLVEAGYLANLSHHLTANDLSINQVPPVRMGPGNAQLLRPFPQFSNVSIVDPPIGNSTYHAFTIKTEKRYSSGLSFLAHYTFSKFIDDVASFNEFGDPGGYMDFYNRRLDKSLSGNDIRHRAVISGVYELPFLRGQKRLEAVLGGWKAGVIASFQSGAPFTVISSRDETNAFPAGAVRPDLVGNPAGNQSLAQWFNTDAFRFPAPNHFGTSPRSVLRGPGVSNVDLSLIKEFAITERWKTELRGEFFNALNHTNFRLPNHALGTPAFGTITGARAARSIQLGLRISF